MDSISEYKPKNAVNLVLNQEYMDAVLEKYHHGKKNKTEQSAAILIRFLVGSYL